MADKQTVRDLEAASLGIKLDLLQLCRQTEIHIGGDLSVCDIMTALWQYGMDYDPNDPTKEERDRFVLSKGHASAVTSLNQVLLGCYKKEDVFGEYATNYGRFGKHSCNLINIHVEVSTGSLGHGLPIAGGIAMALRLKGNSVSRVYTVMGDGEQAEGSIWEAAMSARQFKLGNLVGIVDRNRCSLDGHTEDVMKLEPFAEKWRAFGWRVVEIDGHDMEAVVDALDGLPDPSSDVPTVIIANTVKGHGVSFMEDDTDWHSGSITERSLEIARAELIREYEKKKA